MPGVSLLLVVVASAVACIAITLILLTLLFCILTRHKRVSSSPSSSSITFNHTNSAKTSTADYSSAISSSALNPNPNSTVSKSSISRSSYSTSHVACAWRKIFPIRPFSWKENPSPISTAVEEGWSAFAFHYSASALLNSDNSTILHHHHRLLQQVNIKTANQGHSLAKALSSLVTGSDLINADPNFQPLTTWEINAGCDYTQKIRVNPGFDHRSIYSHGPLSNRIQALQTSLPLPGPTLGSFSFPEEAYFEVSVQAGGEETELLHHRLHQKQTQLLLAPGGYGELQETDRIKLIAEPAAKTDLTIKTPSTSTSYGGTRRFSNNTPGSSVRRSSAIDDDVESISAPLDQAYRVPGLDLVVQEDAPVLQSSASEQWICAVGLAAGCAPPFRLPGSDAASVGFFSNGRVFMNGIEQKKPPDWKQRIWSPSIDHSHTTNDGNQTVTIVGCGFNPTTRRLFFTLNGNIVEDLSIPSTSNSPMTFANHPLFPTIAANHDVTFIANFGQAPFAYKPANAHRLLDPCFQRPPISHKMEDSGELFSMGQINSEWLSDLGESGDNLNGASLSLNVSIPLNKANDVESDFFEIKLDIHN